MKMVFRYAHMVMRFLSLFIILASCASQKQLRSGLIPPGTVQLNDTLFVDKTEVANIHWREYLFYLFEFGQDAFDYQKALPDTSVWGFIESKRDSFVTYIVHPLSEIYFRHPGFNNYPVVGISYEQAVQFCKWRTYEANRVFYFKENKIKDPKLHLRDKFPIRFVYRLPTKEEWETIAAPGIDSTQKGFKKYNKGSAFSYNSKERIEENLKLGKYHDIDPRSTDVKSFYVSKSGTYNMIGNVAEMISENTKAKGGSFAHSLDSCNTVIDLQYSKPENWLGFRCVAIIVK